MEAKSFGQAPLVRAQTLSYKEEKGLQGLSMHALFHILVSFLPLDGGKIFWSSPIGQSPNAVI